MGADNLSVELGDVVRQRAEETARQKEPNWPYIGLEHLASGSPDLLGSSPSSASTSTNSVFRRDDILFGKLRPYLRKCVRAPFEGYCSTDLLVLEATERSIPRYAARLCQSERVFAAAVSTSIGTKMPRTSWGALRRVPVYLPSLPEQRRIAEILDTLDEAIRKTEQVIAKLQQVKQGLLHDLLTRGIDENGELRDPERHPEQFKDSPLGRIPREWQVETVEALLASVDPAMRSGPFGSALLKEELVEQGVPLLGIDNVHVENFVERYSRFVTPAKAAELARYMVRPHDVMITIMGTVGRCCVVPEHIGEALSSKHVWTLTLDDTRYSQFLACLQINHSPWVLTHFGRDEQGGIMSAIRSETLRTTRLPVPPRTEQAEIEAILSDLQGRLAGEAAMAAKLRLLKQGLMDDLLTGRVRVEVPEEASA